MIIKICDVCKKEYEATGKNQKWCVYCKVKKIKCLVCGKEKYVERNRLNERQRKYCSIWCSHESQRKHLTEEEKKVKKREYGRKYNKTRKKRDKVLNVIYTQNYRAKKLKNGGVFTKKEWKYIKWLYNQRCAICQKKKKLTIDHIIPVSKKGRNDFDNIQPLCQSCNSIKGTNLIV